MFVAILGDRRSTLPAGWTKETAIALAAEVAFDAAAGVGPGASLTFVGLAGDLVVDPLVGLLQAVPQPGVGFPTEDLLDQGVIAVSAVHALGGAQVVVALQFDAADLLGDVDELVDRHALG